MTDAGAASAEIPLIRGFLLKKADAADGTGSEGQIQLFRALSTALFSCTLILLSAVLTTLGWYQKLAAKAGAGSLVPITGFANAVVSAAIEFKAEGRVPGTGAKIFLIAGPVIVYGTLAAVVYGVVLWLLGASAL